jgi:hypothetical protein
MKQLKTFCLYESLETSSSELRIFTGVIYCRFGLWIIRSRPFARLGNDLKTFWPFCFLQY